jgi:NAD(P)H-dependent FMN reductase
MNVAILLGTVRQGRQSHRAAYYLEKQLKKQGVNTDLIDLAKHPLPVFGSPESGGSSTRKIINDIGMRLEQADALILVTPEYHGSFSGALKNALDYYWSEFQKKPVGVVAASSGRMAGINAATQLQHVILSLGAFPLPSKFLVSNINQAFNDLYEPQLEQIKTRARKFLNEFLWFAGALYQKKGSEKVA